MVDLAALGDDVFVRALQDSADRLALGLVVMRVSPPERVLFASEAAAAIFGRRRVEIEGSSPFDLLAPEAVAVERERLESRGLGAAAPISFETLVLRPDGVRVPIEVAMTRVITENAALNVAFVRDITAQRAAINTLRASEERFRRVVEGAPDGVVILERGRITFMNELAATLLELPNPAAGIGTMVTDHLLPEDAAVAAERIGRMLATGVSFDPTEYRPRRNVDRIVEIKSIVTDRENNPKVIAFARDVTARKRIERELVRSDRLASIGMLSAAVAHEINNPLAYVRLCLQYLERELPALMAGEHRERVLEQLRNATHGVSRVATIVRDLRTFARADDTEVGQVDVVACIESAIKLVDNDLRHRAHVTRDFADVPAVHANASRLEQVFLNLLINAAQAIPAGEPAANEIRIEARAHGEGVTITVRDTGGGISPELRDRVFEPFFSTKAVGVGTGLGLAVCRSIVEQVGGRIELETSSTRGAVVTVTLPVHRGEPPTISVAPIAAPQTTQRLRVLVVDDEPLVRRALSTVLSREHDVALAEHGRRAIELIAENRFDVVLCDLMMPVMNGKEVYEHVRERDPALARRFVFITGGALGSLSTFVEQASVPVLHKPFEVTQIITYVAAAAER